MGAEHIQTAAGLQVLPGMVDRTRGTSSGTLQVLGVGREFVWV